MKFCVKLRHPGGRFAILCFQLGRARWGRVAQGWEKLQGGGVLPKFGTRESPFCLRVPLLLVMSSRDD